MSILDDSSTLHFLIYFLQKEEVIVPNYTMTKANGEVSHLNSPPRGSLPFVGGRGDICSIRPECHLMVSSLQENRPIGHVKHAG